MQIPSVETNSTHPLEYPKNHELPFFSSSVTGILVAFAEELPHLPALVGPLT
jgi:hypothetical protein